MKKFYFALAAVAAIFAGCSNEVEPEQPTPVIVIEKNVSLSASVGDPLTKVSSDNAGIFKWQSTDKITAVTDGNAIRQFEVGDIEAAGTSAEFNGSIPDGSSIAYALYPASESHNANGDNITFHLDENVTWKADASGMPMIATVVDDEASFKSVGGVLKLLLFNIPAEADYLKFSATNKKITGDFTIAKASIASAVLTTADKSNSDNDNELVIDFSANDSANKVFYIPLPTGTIDGFTVALYETLEASPLFSVTSPKSLSVAANKLIIAPAIDASANTPWKEDFSSFAANDVPSGEQASGVTYSCVNGGSDTKVYAETYAGGVSPELLVGKSTGSFSASGIPTNNAGTLTLKYKTNAQSLSLSSSTDGVTFSTTSTSTAEEHTITITNSKNASTISLTFTPGSKNVRLDDIVLTVPGQGFTAPSINVNDAELTIGVGQNSASTTVSLANAVDNLGISAILSGDNADKFTATIDGTTLTVTASEINSTDAAYTATVTLKASGATAKTISVTQESALVPNPEDEDLTATPGDGSVTVTWPKGAHATSYVAYRHTDETESPASVGTDVSSNISISGDICTLTLTGLTNNTTYHLYVKVNGVDDNYSAASDFAHVSFKPVAAKVLESIALTTPPTTTTYNVGDNFSLAGAVVTATYNDETTADVTESCTSTYDFSTAGNKTVIISYTEETITKTCECNVTVAIVDVLNNAWTGISGTNYASETKTGSGSGATYSIQAAGGNSSIQLRSSNSNSGIVTTSSAGTIKKITIKWNSNTDNARTVDIYGKNSTYSDPTDLYSTNTQGTKVKSFTKSAGDGSYTFEDDYEYIGIRSYSGALYIDEIDIEWEPAATKYDVTIDSGISNGSVSASVSKAKEGDTVTLTATPTSGYALTAWDVYKTGDSSTKVDVDNNEFTMPAYGVTVSATFAAVPTISFAETINDVPAAAGTYTIDDVYELVNEAVVGKVTVSDPTGDVTDIALGSDEGSIEVTVNANTGAARTAGTFKIKYDNQVAHTVTVNQVAATYTLTVASVDNGTISATVGASDVAEGNTLTVACGSSVSLSQEAASNYSFSAWDVYQTGTYATKVSVSENAFTMPAYNVTVSASFAAGSSSSTTKLTNANIVASTGSTSYGSITNLKDENNNSYTAYAIKNQHSNATSSYKFLQIKKYASSTAYYIGIPALGTKITSIKMTVSGSSQAMTAGSNTATLYFSASNSTSSTGSGVASGTGASSVTIDCSSLNLNSGYITASGAVRIWDVEITYNN